VPVDWITDQIAIGNYIDAREIKSGTVDSILCLIENCCNQQSTEFDVLNIPLFDGAGNNNVSFDDCVDFIDETVSSNQKILVHCHAGRSRSVCIVARYFMIKQGLTSHQAINLIGEKREVYLSPGIEELLKL